MEGGWSRVEIEVLDVIGVREDIWEDNIELEFIVFDERWWVILKGSGEFSMY